MTSRIAKLEAQITELENQRAALSEKVKELQTENAGLKTALSGTLPDFPAESTNKFTWWGQYEKATDAADKYFSVIAEWAGRNYGHGDDDDQRRATGLGIMISHHFGWWGKPLLWAAAAGMEDANWHTETMKLVETFSKHFEPEEPEEMIPLSDVPAWVIGLAPMPKEEIDTEAALASEFNRLVME